MQLEGEYSLEDISLHFLKVLYFLRHFTTTGGRLGCLITFMIIFVNKMFPCVVVDFYKYTWKSILLDEEYFVYK